MPSMQVTGPDGRPRNLTTLRGKPVLLNLWATWCAPCVEELPTINALAARAGDSAHVVALSQDIGGDATVPTAFLAERGWTRIQSWYDPDNAFGIAVGGALPTTILYNSDGLEVGRVIGPLDWTGPQAIDLLTKTGFNI